MFVVVPFLRPSKAPPSLKSRRPAVASASFVFLALFSAQKWLRLALANRFLVYTGTIGYGLYLLHKLPFDAAKSFYSDRHPYVDAADSPRRRIRYCGVILESA